MQGVHRCSAAAWKSLFRRYNLNVGFPPKRRRSTVVSAATPASNISAPTQDCHNGFVGIHGCGGVTLIGTRQRLSAFFRAIDTVPRIDTVSMSLCTCEQLYLDLWLCKFDAISST